MLMSLIFLYFGYYQSYYFLFIAPAVVLALIAQLWLKLSFAKYGKRANVNRITGAEAARRILDENGLRHIEVRETGGYLSDHYDPRSKTVNLSTDVYRSASIAAVGIAAHEVGHAIQHATHYLPLVARHAMVPAVRWGGTLFNFLFFAGALMMYMSESGGQLGYTMMLIAVGLFSLTTLFAFVTLPVEFNASARAMEAVTNSSILLPEEKSGVRSVLTAAAMTYVAAAIQSLLTLLYYLWRLGIIGGRRR